MPDGRVRGIPRPVTPTVASNWPEDWTYPGPVLVNSGEGVGSSINMDTSNVKDGDILVAFGVTRNGTISGPNDGGWTTVYKVDRSSNEWNSVYAKVASGQGSSFNFVMSTTAAAGFGAFRCDYVDITTWQHASTTGGYCPTLVSNGPGIYIGITMSAAFNAVGELPIIGHYTQFAEADASDENVEAHYTYVTGTGVSMGGITQPTNDMQYGSRHSLILY